MLHKTTLALACVFSMAASSARAHFIWIDLKHSDEGLDQAQVYFGEQPEPGEPHLLGKVRQTKVWLRGVAGEPHELRVAPADDKELSALVASVPRQSPTSLEATCDYGVYERGAAGVLLQYHAKHLDGDWAKNVDLLARATRLALDVVPSLDGKQLRLQVLYQGKLSCASQVVVVDPAGKENELKTDDEGRVTTIAVAGRYAVRAAHIEADRSGERDGKKYVQTWHYSTLTFDVPAPGAAEGGDVTAPELLRRARAGRATWNDFPGFTAELEVRDGAEPVTAKAAIDEQGAVTLEMAPSKLTDWVEEQLNTLVQHRMPDGEVAEGNVVYAAEPVDHPQGRKIELGDGDQSSAYRIKDDVIREVNRSSAATRFTISVLEIDRNAENKYLPRSFTMNFFDAKNGELKMSLGYFNDWQRVGQYDLPKTILEINARDSGAATRQIVFKNCRLVAPK